MDSNKLTALRLQLLTNGYVPLPNVDKACRLKDWPRVEVTPEVVPTWAPERALKAPQATGLRVEGGLVAIDVDITDQVLMDETLAMIGRIAPQVILRAPRRNGAPVKTMFIARRDALADVLDSRSGKWQLPDGSTAQIEIFASERRRQIGAFGPHTIDDDTGEVVRRYEWVDPKNTPETVPFMALPALSNEEIRGIYNGFDALAEARGLIRVETAGASTDSDYVFDLTEDTDFGVAVGVTALAMLRKADSKLRITSDFTGVPAGEHNPTKCLVGWSDLFQCVTVYDTKTMITHFPVNARLDTATAPMAGILAAANVVPLRVVSPDPEAYQLEDWSETGFARLYLHQINGWVRYDHQAEAWYRFDGAAWRLQERGEVASEISLLCAGMARSRSLEEADIRRLRSAHFLKGVLATLKVQPGVGAAEKDWDQDAWLVGTPGGTVDLRTGILRDADPRDMIRRSTAVTPAGEADCPQWRAFVAQIMLGDAEKVRFLQQWAGLGLLGELREQVVVFLYGEGGNGKGVYTGTMTELAGDYAVVVDPGLFVEQRFEPHSERIRTIKGARMLLGAETSEKAAWNTELLKAVSGGGKLRGRWMRENSVEFAPVAATTIESNHQPNFGTVDAALTRRFLEVHFMLIIPKDAQELGLQARLIAEEGPGILRWMLDGLADWLKVGRLVVAEDMRVKTAAYFAAEDHVRVFLNEMCEVDERSPEEQAAVPWRLRHLELYTVWQAYARRMGLPEKSSKGVAAAMRKHGFAESATNNKLAWIGVRLPPIAAFRVES